MGNLGSAILAYPGFGIYAFDIAAAFDVNPKKITCSCWDYDYSGGDWAWVRQSRGYIGDHFEFEVVECTRDSNCPSGKSCSSGS